MRYKVSRVRSLEKTKISFLKNIRIVPSTGCWIWTKALTLEGYGAFRFRHENYAHRISYELFVGEIPVGAIICHHCDVKCCVNPEHLYAGSYLSNMVDALKRGKRKLLRHDPLSGRFQCV